METLIVVIIAIIFSLLFSSPFYWLYVIDKNNYNYWNDYKIKTIKYKEETYYVAYVYCGRFYFKKIYRPYSGYVEFHIRHKDTGKCKLFYSEKDLVMTLTKQYKSSNEKNILNKMI